MLIYVIVRPRDASQGTYDAQGYGVNQRTIIARVRPAGNCWGIYDVQVHPRRRDETPTAAPGGFPTQYSGFRVQKTGSTIELCMVAEADAPSGMGGVIKIRKGGVTYALYLVETGDANASPVRVRTTTGTKAVRLKT